MSKNPEIRKHAVIDCPKLQENRKESSLQSLQYGNTSSFNYCICKIALCGIAHLILKMCPRSTLLSSPPFSLGCGSHAPANSTHVYGLKSSQMNHSHLVQMIKTVSIISDRGKPSLISSEALT